MATPLSIKRMTRERRELEKPNPDYFVHFASDDLLTLTAYIHGPLDSLYAHKLIKVRFDIPQNYPIVPPACKFVQHTPGRIHPNLYVDGKVCLSILGTWPGEKWAQAMTIDNVLITIRSLLDNHPYRHEPNQADDPAFNSYVQYHSWTTLLLDYLDRETAPELNAFLLSHLHRNGPAMLAELHRQRRAYVGPALLTNRYGGTGVRVEWDLLCAKLEAAVSSAGPRLAALEGMQLGLLRARLDGTATANTKPALVTAGPVPLTRHDAAAINGAPAAAKRQHQVERAGCADKDEEKGVAADGTCRKKTKLQPAPEVIVLE